MDALWLPKGHHYDLHIEHQPLPDAGTFTEGNWKMIWHTTESQWQRADSMWTVLRDKNAAPHFVIGGRAGLQHPVVIQCIALNRAARALEHNQGPETNRSHCIQIEVCGYAAQAAGWTAWTLKALANLTALIEHRIPVKRAAHHPFTAPGNETRLTADGFKTAASQHLGHQHVPGNTHEDPGALDIRQLLELTGTPHAL